MRDVSGAAAMRTIDERLDRRRWIEGRVRDGSCATDDLAECCALDFTTRGAGARAEGGEGEGTAVA